MSITPYSIRMQMFQTVKKNGYDPDEVQKYLLQVAREVERLLAEIETLKALEAAPAAAPSQLDSVKNEHAALQQSLDAAKLEKEKVVQQAILLQKEIERLRSENAALKARPAESNEMELRVKEVLEEIRKTSDELVEHSKINAAAFAIRAEQERKLLFEQAKKEAEIGIRDAEKKAGAIVDRAQAKVQEYRDEIGILQARRLAIIARVKSLLVSQQQFLEALEQDALGQTHELTDFGRESGQQVGISAEQLETILTKLEEHQSGLS